MSIFGQPGTAKMPAITLSTPTQSSAPSLFGTPKGTSNNAASSGASLFGGATPSSANNAASVFGSNATSNNAASSIFGQNQPASASGASISGGGSAATTQPSGGSLFGASTPTPAAQSTGASLFGSTPAQNTGSLFGGGNNAASTSLFGQPAAGATQAPAASGASLFGAPKPTTPSLFGQSQPAQNTGAASLFGQPQPAQNATAPSQPTSNAPPATVAQTAYFTSLLERNTKRGREDEKQGLSSNPIPSLNLGFGDISKRLQDLGSGQPMGKRAREYDSRAHYLLAASGVSPGNALKDLSSFKAQVPAAPPVPQTQPLTELNNANYVQQIEARITKQMFEEQLAQANRDFDMYVQERIDIDWDLQRKKIYEHFGLTMRNESGGNAASTIKGSFGRLSRKGMPQAPATPGKSTLERSIFAKSGAQKSVLGRPGSIHGTPQHLGASVAANKPDQNNLTSYSDERYKQEKQAKFSDRVHRLTDARNENVTYPIFTEFLSVERSSGDDVPTQLLDTYTALLEIVGENEPEKPRARQFVHEYLSEQPQSPEAIRVRKRIVEGSRRALEKIAFTNIRNFVERNPREARLGGVPTVLNIIKAYVRIRYARKDLAADGVILQTVENENEPCWAIVYFLLRTGHIKEAADYVTETPGFANFQRNFIVYMTTYASSNDRRLNRNAQENIQKDYMAKLHYAQEGSTDPYYMACLKIIGRCDLSRRSLDLVGTTFEDWLWLLFALAREVHRAEEIAVDAFGLAQIQDMVHEIGQKYFRAGNANEGYGVFLMLQSLSGLFEEGVEWLNRHNYVSAVHLAIALDYYGLLRISDFMASETELLTFTTREQPQINFGRMIGYYTAGFRAARPEAALDYLTLICLNSDLPGALGSAQASLCHEALRELVLETREFSLLLGDIRSNGTRIKGLIEKRLSLIGLSDQDSYLRTVTVQAASVADDNGRTTDAVLLYHLAEDYETVVTILNRVLSDTLASESSLAAVFSVQARARQDFAVNDPESSLALTAIDDSYQLAINMTSLYGGNAMYFEKIRPQTREVCVILMKLWAIRSGVAEQRWMEALDSTIELGLLPLTAQGSIPVIRNAAQNLQSVPASIGRLIGPLILWTLQCISRQRATLLDGSSGGSGPGVYDNDTRKALREELVSRAKDIMVFAGLIKLRMGKGVWDGIIGGAAELGLN